MEQILFLSLVSRLQVMRLTFPSIIFWDFVSLNAGFDLWCDAVKHVLWFSFLFDLNQSQGTKPIFRNGYGPD